MEALKGRLSGVLIQRQLEPAFDLLDRAAQMWEARQLKYLSPEKCMSREWEIMHGKSAKQLSIDSEKLLVKESKDTPDQATHNDLQVHEALRRRGIALAFADVMSWEAHETYLQELFQHLRNEPPSGYVKPGIQQILRADRQSFTKVIRDGVNVRRNSSGALEMDEVLMRALNSAEVSFHLLPLPKPQSLPNNPPKPQWTTDFRQQHDWRWQPYGKGKDHSKGKSRKGDKGKGKSKGKGTNFLPKALQGRDNVGTDMHGRRLCYNFNLGKCDKVASGAQCPNGFHLCCRKDCQAPHAEMDHDKQTSS